MRKVSKAMGCGASTLAKALKEAPVPEQDPSAQKPPSAEPLEEPIFSEVA